MKPASQKPSNQTVDGEVIKKRRSIDEAPNKDEALKPYKLFARLAVKLVDKLYELMDEEKLDAEEKEAGVEAFSTLLYEESVGLNGRILVVSWLAMTGAPRAISFVDKKIKERKKTPEERIKEKLQAAQRAVEIVPFEKEKKANGD